MRQPSYQTTKLSRGKHSSPWHGACVMELASMLAGERFTDRPDSVSPVIGAFLRGYNDVVDDARRQDLFRYASEAVGTAGSDSLENARMKRLVEWADDHRGQRPRTRASGSFGAQWARRMAPTEPESAGIYAIRSIHKGRRRIHCEVLSLLDELIAMGDDYERDAQGPSRRSIAVR